MGEAVTRVVIMVLLLGVGIYWMTRPPTVVEADPAPLLYNKGTYMGQPDTGLSEEDRNALKFRARQDYTPRL